MSFEYTLRIDIFYDEEGNPHLIYGVNAFEDGDIRQVFPGIFRDRGEAEKFIDLCNSEQLEIIHLPDVIRDLLLKT